MVEWVADKYPWGTEYGVWGKLNEKEREAVDGIDRKLSEVEAANVDLLNAVTDVYRTSSEIIFSKGVEAAENLIEGKKSTKGAWNALHLVKAKVELARELLKNGTYTEYRLFGGGPEKIKKKYGDALDEAVKELDKMRERAVYSQGGINLTTFYLRSAQSKVEYSKGSETYEALTKSIIESDMFAIKVGELKKSIVSAKEVFNPTVISDHPMFKSRKYSTARMG